MYAFKLGDKAVYPAHGVGVIKRVETRRIGGAATDFFVLQITATGATLMIPADGCERAGMRPLVSADEVGAIYTVLREPARVSHTTWNRRFREFNDLLRTGSLPAVAAVLRDLNGLRVDKDLSYGEAKMADKALSMLVAEVSEATGRTAEAVEAEVRAVLGGDAAAVVLPADPVAAAALQLVRAMRREADVMPRAFEAPATVDAAGVLAARLQALGFDIG